jgi:flagellar hook assembly protein FlgD
VGWDGRDDRGAGMPSGVYFARAEYAGASRTVKLILAR